MLITATMCFFFLRHLFVDRLNGKGRPEHCWSNIDLTPVQLIFNSLSTTVLVSPFATRVLVYVEAMGRAVLVGELGAVRNIAEIPNFKLHIL